MLCSKHKGIALSKRSPVLRQKGENADNKPVNKYINKYEI